MVKRASTILEQRVRTFIAAHQLLPETGRVLVGFSGGADSTALLLILRELAARLTAVHLHHGLRGAAADRDRFWCRRFCRERGIPFRSARLEVPRHRQPGESLEAAARRCRLEWWRAHAGPDDVVALGHHLDDALENLLLRLARGANSSGLAGLRPARSVNGVRLIRPLLCLRRIEIEAFLREAGIADWCEDCSNADTRLRRNAVRRSWLPLMRKTVGHDRGLTATLEALEEDAAFMEAEAERRLASLADIAELRALPPALLPRVLRLWLRAETGQDVILARSSIRRLQQWLARSPVPASRIPIGHGLRLHVAGGRLQIAGGEQRLLPRRWHWRRQPRLELPEAGLTLIAAAPAAASGRGPWAAEAGATEYFAAGDLPAELVVRAWLAGDRMRPFGAGFEKKLQDIFTDARVPRSRRALVPVVLAGERVIWLAGVKRAEFGRLHAGRGRSAAVVQLRLEVGPSPH